MTDAPTPSVVMGHPVLNSNSRYAALALARAGMLRQFITGLDTTTWRVSRPASVATELARRTLPDEVHSVTTTQTIRELARIAATRVPARFNRLDLHNGRLSAQSRFQGIDKALARAVRNPDVTAVYAYEDGAADSFKAALQQGKARIYDLPIGYWRYGREIFETEAQRLPAWAGTLEGLSDPAWKVERKDQELATASQVIVASSFTATTLSRFEGDMAPVTVIPYGTPPVQQPRAVTDGSPVKVLYVGSVGQRKGFADLVAACDLIEAPYELTVVGRPVGHSQERDHALANTTWHPSLPHTKVLELIHQHDVLVLPSLFEGFGLVLSEALSQGTPIIGTTHTAAPDLLGASADAGWVVPIRSPEAIAQAVTSLKDAKYREHTREQALAVAARHTWDAYMQGVVRAVTGQ